MNASSVSHDRRASLKSYATMALCGSALAAALFFGAATRGSAETAVVIPPPAMSEPAATATTETTVLAGGCFWGVQGVFQHVEGVENAVSGYIGGAAETAKYDSIGSGTTGHAEAVRITYDPKVISYGKLLQVYFSVVHNPTELNRQGPDTGPQYRSAIFAESDAQKQAAEAYIRQLDEAKVYDAPIVTTIETAKPFYPAEDYHQDYATLHPDSGYIAMFDLPKIENLGKLFPDIYRAKPKLVSEAGVTTN